MTSCHDPHAASTPKLLVRKGNTLCAECHSEQTQKFSVPHAAGQDGDGCLTCHAPHAGKKPKLLSTDAGELCSGCHADQKGDKAKVQHAPVVGGECVSCQSPHGANAKSMLKDREDRLCYACHVDAENDFVKSVMHAPIRGGTCSTCHQAHGSAVPKLLAKESPALCADCHQTTITPIQGGGGGNWFIEAPHWAFSGTYWWFGGWQPNQPTNWLQYGGVYPIHSGGKIANVASGDGHAKGLSVGAMLRGVSLNASMQVTGVYDQGLYIWDREA